jgi:hypothetical protein
MTVSDLINLLGQQIGTTIRGRVVNDMDVSMSLDGSCCFTAWLNARDGSTLHDRLISSLSDHDELYAYHADIRVMCMDDLVWEYEDEVVARQIAEYEQR